MFVLGSFAMRVSSDNTYSMGGFLVHHVAISNSTNLDASELADNSALDMVAVLADQQSAGMGRNGKVWHSPLGNLYFSVVLRETLHIPTLSLVACIAVGTALEDVFLRYNKMQLRDACQPRVAYKWPNDVMVNGKKISGILLQTKTLSKQHLSWTVCGIGINIHTSPLLTSTSIKEYVPCLTLSNVKLMEMVLSNLKKLLDAYSAYGFCLIRDLWLSKAYNIGFTVQIMTNTNIPHVGKFISINLNGEIILQSQNNVLTIGYGQMI